MHFNARVGMVPLGGNTVAIRRELIERVGGWDTGVPDRGRRHRRAAERAR